MDLRHRWGAVAGATVALAAILAMACGPAIVTDPSGAGLTGEAEPGQGDPPTPVGGEDVPLVPGDPGNTAPDPSVIDPDRGPSPDPGTPAADAGTEPPTDGATDAGTVDPTPNPPTMSFFVTSRGNGKGGDFRLNPTDTDGLAGADAFCQSLAAAVSAQLGAKTWRAYLSTATVSARSRIGKGPWRNQKGVVVAESLAHLHDEGGMRNALSLENSLDENGNAVANSVHDILTGSLENGSPATATCSDWTSSAANGNSAQVGHSNRAPPNPPNRLSWNAAHTTASCSAQGVTSGGGRGSLYCFALE